MIGIAKIVGLVLVGGVSTSVAVATVADTSEVDQGVVERVIDGDTVDVTIDGAVQRVRLLNIDTPETVDPEQPVQCLGPGGHRVPGGPAAGRYRGHLGVRRRAHRPL